MTYHTPIYGHFFHAIPHRPDLSVGCRDKKGIAQSNQFFHFTEAVRTGKFRRLSGIFISPAVIADHRLSVVRQIFSNRTAYSSGSNYSCLHFVHSPSFRKRSTIIRCSFHRILLVKNITQSGKNCKYGKKAASPQPLLYLIFLFILCFPLHLKKGIDSFFNFRRLQGLHEISRRF